MDNKETLVTKKWTDEERLKLAEKLDADLDSFIDSLEKKRYTDGWPEDRWEEEMDKHPFFMKRAPQPGDDVHPMFEGLQKLKYDPEENTLEELALNYKEDGNFYMKHKKYRMAVLSFTEGIKVKCDNAQVQAVLYNNRSAAHYFLENYRSALSDAQRALVYKTNYMKARWRAAQCAYKLDKFDLCTELCNEIIEQDLENKDAQTLLKKSKEAKIGLERNKRKAEAEVKKHITRFHRLCDALKTRHIAFEDHKHGQNLTEDMLVPKFLPLENYPVHLDDDNETLIWPAAYSYPEFLISDFQQQVPENIIMADCIDSILKEPLPCDKFNTYCVNKINVYYENRKSGTVHLVDMQKTIKEILQEKDFFVTGGALLFYIVPMGSTVEQDYISQLRRPIVYTQ